MTLTVAAVSVSPNGCSWPCAPDPKRTFLSGTTDHRMIVRVAGAHDLYQSAEICRDNPRYSLQRPSEIGGMRDGGHSPLVPSGHDIFCTLGHYRTDKDHSVLAY